MVAVDPPIVSEVTVPGTGATPPTQFAPELQFDSVIVPPVVQVTPAWPKASGVAASDDVIERASSRPDFAVLAYPVITLTNEPYVHKGSRRNLLGDNPDPKLVANLSNELAVTRETPPCFLFHTNADTGVPPENSILFYMALRKNGVPAELHIYENGPHGVGLAWSDIALSTWPARLADWLRNR